MQLLLVRFDLVHKLVERDLADRTVPGRPSEKLRHHPFGVVGVIGPFNFPLHLCHAHVDPGAVHRQRGGGQAERRHAAGRPALRRGGPRRRPAAGVFNMVQGGAEAGAALVAHPAVRGLCFTGSYRVGRLLAQTCLDRPEVLLALEMGGKNTAVVLDDADLHQAAHELVARRLPDDRPALHRDRAGPGPPGSRRRAHRSPAPPGLGAPLRRSRRPHELRRPADHRGRADPGGGRAAGGARRRRRAGGRRPGRPVGGGERFFMGPSLHLLPDGRHDVAGYTDEELFGPDLCVETVADDDEAIAVMRASPLRPGHQRVHRRRRALRALLPRDPLRHRQPQPLDQPGQPAAAVRRGGPQRQLPPGRLARAAQRRLPGRGAGERARLGPAPPAAGRR